jgi:hypothetical protein
MGLLARRDRAITRHSNSERYPSFVLIGPLSHMSTILWMRLRPCQAILHEGRDLEFWNCHATLHDMTLCLQLLQADLLCTIPRSLDRADRPCQ